MTSSSATGRAMGTTVTAVVHGGRNDAAAMVGEIARLERSWSRFLPESDLNRLNDRAGNLTVVSPTLLHLVQYLEAAHRLTGGRFDPGLGSPMVALGYDRTYRDLVDVDGSATSAPSSALSGARLDGLVVLPSASAVLVPTGIRLDPGGLGKGLAADLVTASAMRAGADGALVDLGGDIVVRGTAPDGGPWRVDVPGTADQPRRIVELHDGAVATSDTSARTWLRGGERHCHILDPATGRPLERDRRATVVAGTGWWAEAVATATLVSAARNDSWHHDIRSAGPVAAVYVSALDLAHA